MRFRCLSLLLPVMVVACSYRADPSEPNDPVAAQKVRRLCDETHHAVFRAADACCSDADRTTDLYQSGVSFYGDGLLNVVDLHGHDVACVAESAARAHHVEVDDAALEGCIADYRAALARTSLCGRAITRFHVASAACASALVAARGEGQACTAPYECRPGLACTDAPDGSHRKCLPSTDCMATGCKDDLVCNTATRGCEPASPLGGSCANELHNAKACAAGLSCDLDTHTCVAQKKVGEACRAIGGISGSNDCEPSVSCLDGICSVGRATDAACKDTFFSTDCKGRCTKEGTCAAFCSSG